MTFFIALFQTRDTCVEGSTRTLVLVQVGTGEKESGELAIQAFSPWVKKTLTSGPGARILELPLLVRSGGLRR